MKDCIASASMLGMFLNIIITTIIAIARPIKKITDNERKKPLFFFKEMRLGQLVFAGLFNIGRLIYEAALNNPSSAITSTMVVITVRIIVTVVVFMEHRWLCNNWEKFYIEREQATLIWFIFFSVTCLIHIATGIRQLSLTHDGIEMMFSFVGGVNMLVWYYWGKKWKFQWGDMTDIRRLVALRNAMGMVTILYLIYSLYDIFMYDVISALTPLVVMVGHFTLTSVLVYLVRTERTNRRGFWRTYKASKVVVVEQQEQQQQQQQPPPQPQQQQPPQQSQDEKEMDATVVVNSNGQEHEEKKESQKEIQEQTKVPIPKHTTSGVDDVVPNGRNDNNNDDISTTIAPKIPRTTRPAGTDTTEAISPNWRFARRPKRSSHTPSTMRSVRATWSVMRRTSVNVFSRDQRETLEASLQRQDFGFLIGDKIATVVAQVARSIPPPSILYILPPIPYPSLTHLLPPHPHSTHPSHPQPTPNPTSTHPPQPTPTGCPSGFILVCSGLRCRSDRHMDL